MQTKMADVTIHIDEETSIYDQEALRDKLLQQNGVMAADFNGDKAHLMVVAYNPDVINSSQFLTVIHNMNLHAELIGM
jgi:hypothetical protein